MAVAKDPPGKAGRPVRPLGLVVAGFCLVGLVFALSDNSSGPAGDQFAQATQQACCCNREPF